MTFQVKHILLLALALAVFSSCEDDKSGTCGPAFSAENTVTIRLNAAVVSLNPLLTKTGYDGYVAEKIIPCMGIVEPKTLELQPLLIKEMPQVYTVKSGPYSGLLAYDFEIYDEAVWDNGTPVTANDIIFTLKLIFHPQLPIGRYRGYFEYLKAVEADPANPKKFTTYFSQYYFLALQSLLQMPVFPAYNYDPENQLSNIPLSDFLDAERVNQVVAANPGIRAWVEAFQSPKYLNDKNFVSGCGPYRVEQFDADQGIILVKKPNWWGDKLVSKNPYLGAFPQKLVYRFIKDEPPTESLIRSGGLDVIPELSAAKFLELKKDSCLDDSYDFTLMGTTSYSRVSLNLRTPELADKNVRQALAHTVDYNYLLNTVQQGLAQRIVGPVNPAKAYFAKNITPRDYNIEKAKALLAASGWKDSNGDGVADKELNGVNTPLEIDLVLPASKVSELTAQSIQTTARNAGFKINLIKKDITIYRDFLSTGDFEMAISGAALYPGLNEFYQNYHTKSIGIDNRFNLSDPALDALIEQIRTQSDEAKRNELYVRAQELIHDLAPELYLYAAQQRLIVSKRFNYVLSPNRPGHYEQYFRLLPQ